MEINIQEILEKHTFPDSYNLSVGFNSAIKEIITEVLREAADSAKLTQENYKSLRRSEEERYDDEVYINDYTKAVVAKSSIKSVINKVKF